MALQMVYELDCCLVIAMVNMRGIWIYEKWVPMMVEKLVVWMESRMAQQMDLTLDICLDY